MAHAAHADHDGHSHDHHRGASKRTLVIVLGLMATHMAVEIAGSIIRAAWACWPTPRT